MDMAVTDLFTDNPRPSLERRPRLLFIVVNWDDYARSPGKIIAASPRRTRGRSWEARAIA